MAENPDALMIAGGGSVNVAPVGTDLPVGPVEDLDPDFIDLGLVHEDGVSWRNEKTTEPIKVWGSFFAVKFRVTEATSEQEFILKQFDRFTLPLAFGGGTITHVPEVAGPPIVPEYWVYTPAAPEDLDERALVLDWRYATWLYRLVVPRVMVSGSVETVLSSNQESELPVTLGLLGTPGVDAYTLYTNDPAFEAAA